MLLRGCLRAGCQIVFPGLFRQFDFSLRPLSRFLEESVGGRNCLSLTEEIEYANRVRAKLASQFEDVVFQMLAERGPYAGAQFGEQVERACHFGLRLWRKRQSSSSWLYLAHAKLGSKWLSAFPATPIVS